MRDGSPEGVPFLGWGPRQRACFQAHVALEVTPCPGFHSGGRHLGHPWGQSGSQFSFGGASKANLISLQLWTSHPLTNAQLWEGVALGVLGESLIQWGLPQHLQFFERQKK